MMTKLHILYLSYQCKRAEKLQREAMLKSLTKTGKLTKINNANTDCFSREFFTICELNEVSNYDKEPLRTLQSFHCVYFKDMSPEDLVSIKNLVACVIDEATRKVEERYK